MRVAAFVAKWEWGARLDKAYAWRLDVNRDLPKGVCCYRSAVEWGLYQLGKKEDISKRSGVSSDASVLTYLRMQVLLWWDPH